MDFDKLASADCLEKLKCNICNNYLSYFPIFVMENATICGRCPLPLNQNYIRMEAYEAVAQFMKFPCRYKLGGCVEMLTPAQVEVHEKNCFHQQITCPTLNFTECNWNGFRSEILEHCQGIHKDLILSDGSFKINLNESFQRNNLLTLKNDTLCVFSSNYEANLKLFKFRLRHVQNSPQSQSHQYQLKLLRGRRNFSLDSQTVSISDENVKDTQVFLHSLEGQDDEDNVSISGTFLFTSQLKSDDTNRTITDSIKCSSCHKVFDASQAIIKCKECDGSQKKVVTSFTATPNNFLLGMGQSTKFHQNKFNFMGSKSMSNQAGWVKVKPKPWYDKF